MAENYVRFRDADEDGLIALVRTRSPRMLADGLWWLFPFKDARIPAGRVLQIFVDGLAERTEETRREFAGFVFGREMSTMNGIPIVDDLVDRGLLECAEVDYLRYVARGVLAGGTRERWERKGVVPSDPARLVRDESRFRETVLWQLFSTEGAGRLQYQNWYAPLGEYLLRHTELRERALDESLAALLRDFSAADIAGYLAVVKALAPSPAEIVARQSLLIRILSTTPGTGVTAAQELLHSVAAQLTELDDLASATAVVAARTEKKQTLAQLVLLERIAAAQPSAADAMRSAAAAFLVSPNLQVAERARGFIGAVAPAPLLTASEATVTVPGPRRAPRLLDLAPVPVIADADELAALLARLLEHPYPAEDLVSAAASIEKLRRARPATAAALLSRAQSADMNGWIPGEVGALVLRWLTGRAPTLAAAEFVAALDYTEARAAAEFRRELVREVKVPFWHPRVLFAQWINETVGGGFRRPVAKTIEAIREHGAPHSPHWRRVSVPTLDRATNLSSHLLGWSPPDPPYVFWADDGAPKGSGIARVFDMSDLAERPFVQEGYFGRARWDQSGLPDWWRWLLVRAPDHLAAHAIPTLLTATQHPHAQTAPVIDALGATHTPLGPPSWDALALGLADKSAEGRARAAEAIAALAVSGFLEPDALGTALTDLLDLAVMPAARVAASLDDAASISAISGWRILQTLTGMLPRLSGPATARFVEVAGRLAQRFGIAVEIPEPLASKRTGAVGAALRVLSGVRQAPTAEVAEAAAQAEAALAR